MAVRIPGKVDSLDIFRVSDAHGEVDKLFSHEAAVGEVHVQ